MKKGIVLMALFLSQLSFADNDLKWEEKKSKNGIVAYTAEVENSVHLAFKGETVMQGVTLDQMIEIMRDVPGMANWLHTCYEPSIVREEEGLSRIVWMKNSTPTVLVSDRDLVLRQNLIRKSATSATLELTGLPKELPESKGFVRIPYFKGEWTFDETDAGLKVTYSGVIDPGGALPAFVTNAMVVDTPFETLKKLRRVAAK